MLHSLEEIREAAQKYSGYDWNELLPHFGFTDVEIGSMHEDHLQEALLNKLSSCEKIDVNYLLEVRAFTWKIAEVESRSDGGPFAGQHGTLWYGLFAIDYDEAFVRMFSALIGYMWN